MDPLDELRGFIDNDQFVSFRWFANCLDIHVESAKTILSKFKESNKDVFATYCVSGLLKNQQQSISIVPESSLARCKELFSVINCIHVYSIQKVKFLESGSVSAQLNAADVQQANELTVLQTPSTSFLLNGLGGIKMDGSDVKPVGQRAPVRAIVVASSSSDTSAEGQMMKSFAKAGSKKEQTAASSSSAKDNKEDKKASAVATSFFAATAASSSAKVVPEKKKPAPKEIANKIKAKPAEKLEKVEKVVNTVKGGEEDDNDDEWTEEGADTASYKPDKKKLKSLSSNIPTSSSGSTVDLDLTSSQSTTDDSQPPEADSEPIAKKYVHGPMDDYRLCPLLMSGFMCFT
jgi:hypothetical protein